MQQAKKNPTADRVSSGFEQAAGGALRVTLLSAPGRSALAVVGLTGAGCVELATSCFAPHGGTPLTERPVGAICVGRWIPSGEELIIVRTSAASLELHCHGGTAAAEAVLVSLESGGAVRQPWPQWFTDSGVATIETEARTALARAGGPRAARILSRQVAGALQRELDRLTALVTAEKLSTAMRAEVLAALDRLALAARIGLRLVSPWRVVVVGKVNAGKSSLVNALVGYARSLVALEPGTTRDVLHASLVLAGWEIELADTAGLREESAEVLSVTTALTSRPLGGGPVRDVEREGIGRGMAAAAAADLVLRVVDCRKAPRANHAYANELLVLSKIDLAGPTTAQNWPDSAVQTSALAGTGIDALAAGMISRLMPEDLADPLLLSGPVPFTQRQVEIIAQLRRLAVADGPQPTANGHFS